MRKKTVFSGLNTKELNLWWLIFKSVGCMWHKSRFSHSVTLNTLTKQAFTFYKRIPFGLIFQVSFLKRDIWSIIKWISILFLWNTNIFNTDFVSLIFYPIILFMTGIRLFKDFLSQHRTKQMT